MTVRQGQWEAGRRVARAVVLALAPGMLVLAGCTSLPDAATRTQSAERLATAAGLQAFVPAAAPLPLRGFARLGCPGEAISVYIEGDGLAWISVSMPSPDPTPLNPVALQLAALDPGCNVVYLGRPGQYRGGVDSRYWLGARFAPEVIDSYVAALHGLARAGTAFTLTGYSGGGAVATLVAARLQAEGVSLVLRTVAGNLDTDVWTKRRKLSPLAGSLNPASVAAALATVPQLHLRGRRDRQVPAWVLESYLARLPARNCVRVVDVDADHAGPWREAWSAALAQPPACAP